MMDRSHLPIETRMLLAEQDGYEMRQWLKAWDTRLWLMCVGIIGAIAAPLLQGAVHH